MRFASVELIKPCSRCGKPQDREGQRYCRACQNAWKREHRPKHRELRSAERKKANCRAYANVYKRRGKLTPEPCRCGEETVEMHHSDYSKPLKVDWMCRECHVELHS